MAQLSYRTSTAAARRQRDIERLGPWFHNIHFPDGTETSPTHELGDFPRYKWKVLSPHLPQRLDGWTVLDIGCNAGFYSFELARRGAQVTGIDVDPHYLDQARWVARELELESSVEFRRMQVYDLARSEDQFDLVLFLGVFYHLRYPLLGLDIVARRARRLLAFQTLTTEEMEVQPDTEDRPLDERAALRAPGWPRMAFIERRFAGDPTNWWVPNHAAVLAMLRSSGLQVRSALGHELYMCEPMAMDAPERAPYDYAQELHAACGQPWI
ncbi:MAG TPA: TIGR04290 family methyltransferase [Gemmatimonadales bacterium]|nr:TIGR04290 family methyltransferase [Gemmatimonadales bacterium]